MKPNAQTLLASLLAAAFMGAAPAAYAVTFAVNEGATYRVADTEIQAKYKPIADELSHLTGQKVTVVPVADYKELSEGLASGKYDLAYVHPAHIAMKALAADGYTLVAATKGFTEYKAHFIVRADSAAKAPADLKGKKVGSPSPDSITAVLMRTTLKESIPGGAEQVNVVSTRYQDAIPFMVKEGLVDVGVTGSDSVAKAWTAQGGRVAFTSKPVPVKLLLASGKMPAADVTRLQGYLFALDQSDKGRKVLETMDKKGFVAYDGKQVAAVQQLIAGGAK